MIKPSPYALYIRAQAHSPHTPYVLSALCTVLPVCVVYVFLLQAFVSFKYILSHFRKNTGYCRLIVQNSASDFDSEGSLSPALLISVMVWSSAA